MELKDSSSSSLDQPSMNDLKAALERATGQVQMATLQKREDKFSSGLSDEIVRHDLRDIADTIRKDVFSERKVDKTPQYIGMLMATIAVISAMTAVIKPMNDQTALLRADFEKYKSEQAALLVHHEEGQDTQMIRMEARIKEGLKDANTRMDTILADDATKEKEILAKIDSAESVRYRDHHQVLAEISQLKDANTINAGYNMKIDMLEKTINRNSNVLDTKANLSSVLSNKQ